MGVRVGIAGASGYVGAELARLLLAHPEVELGMLSAREHAGATVTSVHPQLTPLADRVFHSTTAAEFAGHDVVFLALPHGHSAEFATQLSKTTVVIDCGADHRLVHAEDWRQWYGGSHAAAWPYGLPELPGARERLIGTARIAVPGCHATAAILAIAPALAAGIAEPDVVVVSATGTSGAGKKPQPHLTGSEVMGAMSAYGVGGVHRHTPEIAQSLSAAARTTVRTSFTPTLAPMARGILATVTAPVVSDRDGEFGDEEAAAELVRSCYTAAYGQEHFVELLPKDRWPTTAAVLGANTVHIQVAFDPNSRRIVAVAALDNLVKGAAGAAVQCMNLAVGLPEAAGLTTVGLAP